MTYVHGTWGGQRVFRPLISGLQSLVHQHEQGAGCGSQLPMCTALRVHDEGHLLAGCRRVVRAVLQMLGRGMGSDGLCRHGLSSFERRACCVYSVTIRPTQSDVPLVCVCFILYGAERGYAEYGSQGGGDMHGLWWGQSHTILSLYVCCGGTNMRACWLKQWTGLPGTWKLFTFQWQARM